MIMWHNKSNTTQHNTTPPTSILAAAEEKPDRMEVDPSKVLFAGTFRLVEALDPGTRTNSRIKSRM